MTQEQKARRYDEAVKEAAIAYKDEDKHLKATLERIFPELKESEDELTWLTRYIEEEAYSLSMDIRDNEDRIKLEKLKKSLAWLEKQSEKPQGKSALESWKDMRLEVYQQASGNRHEPNYSDDATKMFSLNDIDEIIERIAESREGKPADNVEPTDYNSIDPHFGKPIDKVEPKFHAGDWVIDKQGIVHQVANVVENVTNHTYGYDIVGGGYFNDNSEGVRLWTISDAKDGDVLVASDGSIFLFAGVVDCACKYYAALATDGYVKINKEAKDGYWETSRAVYPATKEQRDKLEKAMSDAGYAFDFDKKELKKIRF